MELLPIIGDTPLPFVTNGGQRFSIDHLKPVERFVTVPLRGNFSAKLLIEFRFMNHCYTRSVGPDELVVIEDLISEGPQSNQRNRVFCPVRYAQSFHLMGHIDRLIQVQGDVYVSQHKNFFSVQPVLQDDLQAVRSMYFVFMDAKKKKAPNTQTRILVTVQSAYVENPSIPPPSTKHRAGFLTLLGRAWTG